jgi:phage tail sheath protein FI
MPEYLAPGVFVEETSFRQKSIEGVSTSTTGFVGPCRFGPTDGEPPLLTSFSDFERIYGGIDQLDFAQEGRATNDLAHAVRAYFEEGGRRLYVARTFNDLSPADPPVLTSGQWSDGVARATAAVSPARFSIRARYPGAAGNVRVSLRVRLSANVLVADADSPTTTPPTLQGARPFDVVWARTAAQLESSPPGGGELYWVDRYYDEDERRDMLRLRRDTPQPGAPATGAVALTSLGAGSVQILTVSVLVGAAGRFGEERAWEDLQLHPGQSRPQRRSLTVQLAADPVERSIDLFVPLVIETDDDVDNGALIAEALLSQPNLANVPILDVLASPEIDPELPEDQEALALRNWIPSEPDLTVQVDLSGGNDGLRPVVTDYTGRERDGRKSGLMALEDIEDISITAAPGSSRDAGTAAGARAALVAHCERMRYRIAILDSSPGQTTGEVQAQRAVIDSTRAALYYPWVRIFDPLTETEIHQPPSGFMAGIYARNDVERGVHKAPANEVVRLALGFETLLNTAQQEVLNPQGINCLRFFEGRGYRVWGARTATSDPEWKYVNVRRYFAYLERSIEKGTQWAVFENNGDLLWANIRRTVEDFLFNEWRSNRLLGTKPEQAFFVRCDRTTMTQNDLDNGRLICLVGVSPLRPAEFVIFRIGQKTADSKG